MYLFPLIDCMIIAVTISSTVPPMMTLSRIFILILMLETVGFRSWYHWRSLNPTLLSPDNHLHLSQTLLQILGLEYSYSILLLYTQQVILLLNPSTAYCLKSLLWYCYSTKSFTHSHSHSHMDIHTIIPLISACLLS